MRRLSVELNLKGVMRPRENALLILHRIQDECYSYVYTYIR